MVRYAMALCFVVCALGCSPVKDDVYKDHAAVTLAFHTSAPKVIPVLPPVTPVAAITPVVAKAQAPVVKPQVVCENGVCRLVRPAQAAGQQADACQQDSGNCDRQFGWRLRRIRGR